MLCQVHLSFRQGTQVVLGLSSQNSRDGHGISLPVTAVHCVCEAFGLTGNLLVWSRGLWPSCPTTRNEAVDKRGMQSLISSLYLLHYLGKQKEMDLCVGAFPSVFPLFYSIGLQVGLQTCNAVLQPEFVGLHPLALPLTLAVLCVLCFLCFLSPTY